MAFSTLRITDPHTHATAHVVPERGALVTRFRVKSDEVLYLDEASATRLRAQPAVGDAAAVAV